MARVRATGAVAVATFAWALVMAILAGNPQLTKIQLNADPAAVVALRADRERLDAARLALELDFVLLVLYGLAFVLFGVLLGTRGRGWHRVAGAAVVAGAVITCTCDVVENVRTLRLLPADGTGAVTQSALDALRAVSYAKWAASAVTVALIALVFAGRGRAWIVTALGILTAAGALVGLLGVLAESPTTLQVYFGVVGLVLPFAGALFVVRPRTFLRGHRTRDGAS